MTSSAARVCKSMNAADTLIGPLIREQQRARVEGYVQSGIDEGAELVFGGKRPDHLAKGFFYEATLFINARNNMRIAQEEIFGPVLTVITYKTEDEAIRIANDSIRTWRWRRIRQYRARRQRRVSDPGRQRRGADGGVGQKQR
jgi:acyl-CoA reductase-like NAD-dependent aldehyde dehydrogenase